MTEAADLIALGRFDHAIKLLSGQPDSAERHALLAAAWLGRRHRQHAAQHVRAALAERPDDPALLFLLGRVHMLAQQAHLAVSVFEDLTARAPHLPGLPEALAAAYRRDARPHDAVRVAQAHPPSQQLLYEKACALLALGEADAALQCFDTVAEQWPELAAGWFGGHAPALEILGEAEAARRLRRALACPRANGKYWAFVAAYEMLRGRNVDELARQHIAPFPKRRPLVDGVTAILPHLAPDWRLFGVSASLLRYALEQAHSPGLVLEFGVRRGASITQIAHAAGQQVHGFDSFEGLPEGWVGAGAGILTAGAELPDVPANVTLHVGWFDDTLPGFLVAHEGKVRLVNIDSDIYSSARTVLNALAPRLQSGSVLVFDEYIGNSSWADDEFKAFQEFVASSGVKYDIIAASPMTKQVAMRLR